MLQHPRERRHHIGTARLLRLGLKNFDLQVCWNLQIAAIDASAVLYPAPDARYLKELPSSQHPRHLLVLDGTWHQARKLHQANTWLHALPHYAIQPDAHDRYRIRREPAPHCTSTLEAVVFALRIMEPETPGMDSLLQAFSTMIDQQVASARPNPRRLKRLRVRCGPVPPAWQHAQERLVLLHAEHVKLRRRGAAKNLRYLAAYHPSSGRSFSFSLDGDRCAEALRSAWQHFAPPDARLVAWNQASLDAARRHLDQAAPQDLLKGIYCNLTHQRCGPIESVTRAHQLSYAPLGTGLTERAARRLGAAWAIVQGLQSGVLSRTSVLGLRANR